MIRWRLKFCLGRKVFSSPSCNFHHSICALVLFTIMNLASSFFTARNEIWALARCRGTVTARQAWETSVTITSFETRDVAE